MLDTQPPFQPPQPDELKGKTKTLHVLVPEAAHMRARMAAIASRVPFKTFMAQLMLSATPITATSLMATPIKASPISSCNQPALAGSASPEPQGQALLGDANADSLNSLKGK